MHPTAHDIIDHRLTAPQAALLHTLRNEDGGDGFAATHAELMAASGIATSRTLRAAIQNLLSAGLITTTKQGRSTVWSAFPRCDLAVLKSTAKKHPLMHARANPSKEGVVSKDTPIPRNGIASAKSADADSALRNVLMDGRAMVREGGKPGVGDSLVMPVRSMRRPGNKDAYIDAWNERMDKLARRGGAPTDEQRERQLVFCRWVFEHGNAAKPTAAWIKERWLMSPLNPAVAKRAAA